MLWVVGVRLVMACWCTFEHQVLGGGVAALSWSWWGIVTVLNYELRSECACAQDSWLVLHVAMGLLFLALRCSQHVLVSVQS